MSLENNVIGDNFNIEAVCPNYDSENQAAFTWRREDGIAIVSGYDSLKDISTHWFCKCGHYIEGYSHCLECGDVAPWMW